MLLFIEQSNRIINPSIFKCKHIFSPVTDPKLLVTVNRACILFIILSLSVLVVHFSVYPFALSNVFKAISITLTVSCIICNQFEKKRPSLFTSQLVISDISHGTLWLPQRTSLELLSAGFWWKGFCSLTPTHTQDPVQYSMSCFRNVSYSMKAPVLGESFCISPCMSWMLVQ